MFVIKANKIPKEVVHMDEDFYPYQSEEAILREEEEARIRDLALSHKLAQEAGDREAEYSFLDTLLSIGRS
jgi:hypothetical protein